MINSLSLVFSEAEIQVLISSIELYEPITTPNNNLYTFFPKNIDEAALYFLGLRQDWNNAYQSLQEKGLLSDNLFLTEKGCDAARLLRMVRPPIYYWYEEANRMTENSPAFDRFCRQLYGNAFRQYNFSNTSQLNEVLAQLNLSPGSKVLELVCSKGFIAEYFSDASGASITGIDNSPEAIRQAALRTQSKQNRLHFEVQNMDSLIFPESSFDAVFSIDTLYMPNDLEKTLGDVFRLVKPGGQLAAFYTVMIDPNQPNRKCLEAQYSPLGLAFEKAAIDFSKQNYIHLQQKHQLGLSLKEEFEKE